MLDVLEILGAGAKRKELPAPEPEPDASAKIQRTGSREALNDECLSSTTWASRLRCCFNEARQSRGRQLRPLQTASSCSGLATEVRAMEDNQGQGRTEVQSGLGGQGLRVRGHLPIFPLFGLRGHPKTLKLRHVGTVTATQGSCFPISCIASQELGLVETKNLYTVDPKEASKRFIQANINGGCHFHKIDDVSFAMTLGDSLPCSRHQKKCPPPSQRTSTHPSTDSLALLTNLARKAHCAVRKFAPRLAKFAFSESLSKRGRAAGSWVALSVPSHCPCTAGALMEK